ncbi:polysaccharide biosynthesis protein [Legionella birminghamensis]|uniref:Polysaccharide biosynthesis protein n=1 Tax=Legionella birminghamensis TaxID=28083 RepID=A0A378I697_9GAMM|nr:DegT/DnrJ/EryC1/StrS family aminotransferase [Legionella birminghamensis]KTC68734.1 polysaccharide biosynthesis protein [Legionella birminghamensis]STX30280.1 polysaccharide biosynthesis protein [Legionella birminghamensis]
MQLINNQLARLSRHHDLINTAVQRVLASGMLILGPECTRFEQLFADYLQVEHCIGLANGTDAIEFALKACGIVAGDLVATVANAGAYTTTALQAIGAKPYFLDVDLNSNNTNLQEVSQAIASGAKAIVVTHLYGLAVSEIAEIAAFCKEHAVPLIEDCAQAHGAAIHNKKVGAFGDAASFSFYPTKNLGALGDGGAVVTRHKAIAEKIRSLRQYGWGKKYQIEMGAARNSRLDELQASILCELLPHLDNDNEQRRKIAAHYSEGILSPNIQCPAVNNSSYVAHLYVIRTTQRDSLREHLLKNQIASDVHYPIPDYRQPFLRGSFPNVNLKNTEVLCNECLSLPCYPEMTIGEVENVIHAINNWQA